MSKDIDRMDVYSGTIDGKHVGQPYKKQWWMKYFDVKECRIYVNCSYTSTVRLKRNIFTGSVYVFTMPDEGNRWNEPGYGWGLWVKI